MFGGEYADSPPYSSLPRAYGTWNDSWTGVIPESNGPEKVKCASFDASAVAEHMEWDITWEGALGQNVVG